MNLYRLKLIIIKAGCERMSNAPLKTLNSVSEV